MAELNDVQKRRIASLYRQDRKLADALQTVRKMETAEELHQVTYLPGWGVEYLQILLEVVAHPKCDYGTALLIFWKIESWHYIFDYDSRDQISDPEVRAYYDAVELIQQKLLTHEFQSKRIAINPAEHNGFQGRKPSRRKETIAELLLRTSPGIPCPQDSLKFAMSDEEWRTLVTKELDYTARYLASFAKKDLEYQPYVDWFIRQNGMDAFQVQNELTSQSANEGIFNRVQRWFAGTNRLRRFFQSADDLALKDLRDRIRAGETLKPPPSPRRNPQLSDDQRRRLYRILELSFDSEPKEPLILELDSADELHHLARNWNWDNGNTDEILRTILNHPLCDFGTALHLYWGADPSYLYARYANRGEITEPRYHLKKFVFVEDFEHKLLTYQFASRRFAFKISEFKNLKNLKEQKLKREIPEPLLQDFPGEPFADDDLEYEANHQDRTLKVLNEVMYCAYSIECSARTNPIMHDAAERFREINLDGMSLKDFSLDR